MKSPGCKVPDSEVEEGHNLIFDTQWKAPVWRRAEEVKKAALNQLYFSTLENFRSPSL